MFFASDNGGPVPDAVLAAITEANAGYTSGYGAEDLMDEVRTRLRDVFEAPEAAVYLVTTGTAANALALATLVQPYETVFCSTVAHVHEDECNAPEFYTGGAKLTLVGPGDRMTPGTLRTAISGEETRGVHGPQRGAVSITQVTEKGHIYSLAELQALCAVAKDYRLPVHLDGARFANAMVALGCSAAEMTWKAGVDVVSFGGTKNGLMGVEAVVFFDPSKGQEFELRRKRGGHLMSKHRYLSAQMTGYLRDNLWITMAEQANASAARLADGMLASNKVQLLTDPVDANMLFFSAQRRVHQALLAGGAVYYTMDGDPAQGDPDALLTGRLVCDWSLHHDSVDGFLELLQSV